MNFKVKKFISMFTLAGIIFSSTPALALTAKEIQRQRLLEQQAQAQALANQKATEAAQMKQQIAQVDTQINQTTSALNQTTGQLGQTETTIESLKSQIAQEEQNLSKEKEKFSKVISEWYMEGEGGLLTVVVGSNSLSEVVSKQQYYDSVKQQLTASIEKINTLKTELNNKKAEQEQHKLGLIDLQKQQSSYRQTIVDQRSFKTSMLNMTTAEQKQYLALVEKLKNDIGHISAQIYAERRASSSGTVGSLGYPYKQPPGVYVVDPWNFYQSECTGYAAWYWNARLGKRWTNTQPGRGSARYWPEIARTLGYSVSSTPRVGAIVSWAGPLYSGDQWGHVAIVEAVNSDGTIDVSEYNYSYEHNGGTRSHISPGHWGSFSYIY